MNSARGMARAAVVVAMAFLLAAGVARADTHAPWPTDWNNWSDPALWVTVGNPGNAADTRYEISGYGAVAYTFNMGKFKVTAGQYSEFLNAVASTDTYWLYNASMAGASGGCNIQRSGLSGSYTYSVASDWANRPVNCVSWGDAARFANWLTNGQPTGAQNGSTTEDGSYYLNGAISDAALLAVMRKSPEQGGRYYIPTEDEWYKAAYHRNDGVTGHYFDYPTGSDSVPSHDVITPDPGNNANFYQNGDYAIGRPYYITEVGAFENSESPYGTFDQGGNVQEWNEAIPNPDPRYPYRGRRGGSYGGGEDHLRAATRQGYYASFETEGTGFRIVEVPEPATLSLLAVGGLAALVRRRWRK